MPLFLRALTVFKLILQKYEMRESASLLLAIRFSKSELPKQLF